MEEDTYILSKWDIAIDVQFTIPNQNLNSETYKLN